MAALAIGTGTACGIGGPDAATPSVAPAVYPTEFSSELLGPMSALPACDVEPVPDGRGDVDGLVLPSEATIVQRRSDGTMTQVTGWVDLTPIQLLDRYVRREDIALEQAEHEQFEAELLYEVDVAGEAQKVFIKAQVACATGSNLVAFLAPAALPGAVPTPAGGASPPLG